MQGRRAVLLRPDRYIAGTADTAAATAGLLQRFAA